MSLLLLKCGFSKEILLSLHLFYWHTILRLYAYCLIDKGYCIYVFVSQIQIFTIDIIHRLKDID